MHLTVVSPFTRKVDDEDHTYQRGDKIFELDVIKEVLAGENASHVVKTADFLNGSVPQPKADLTKLN